MRMKFGCQLTLTPGILSLGVNGGKKGQFAIEFLFEVLRDVSEIFSKKFSEFDLTKKKKKWIIFKKENLCLHWVCEHNW